MILTRLLATALLFGFLSAVAAPAEPAVARPAALRPNIVFILADDLGYGDLGSYGQKIIKTPNLDRMAAEGVRFTQHYSGSPVCAPSRASLMTGLHSGHSRIRGNGPSVLRPDPLDLTVGTILQRAGYRTAMIGKSSVAGHSADPAVPNAKGFDHFFGFLHHTLAHDYFPPQLVRDGVTVDYPKNTRHEGDHYTGDLFVTDALAWLDANHDRPFALFYTTQLPHASLYAPEESKAPYRGRFPDAPAPFQDHYRNEAEPEVTFAAMVSRLDWEAGRLLAKLKELGVEKNTLVIFTSDNGAMTEGGHLRATFNSSGALRGGKRDLYEGGVRVPLIARWPAAIAPGTTTAHVSAFWDFLPTACDLAGVATPEGLDGISYLPTLLARTDGQKTHEYLYWEFYEEGGKRAVRLGPWKGLQLDVGATKPGDIALYNLDNDLAETRDVAAQHPEIVARVRALFTSAHTPSPLWSWQPAAVPTPPSAAPTTGAPMASPIPAPSPAPASAATPAPASSSSATTTPAPAPRP